MTTPGGTSGHPLFRSQALFLVLTLLGGCAFAEDALWPSITGKLPAGTGEPTPDVMAGGDTSGLPQPGEGRYPAPGLSPDEEALAALGGAQQQLTVRLVDQQASLDARDGRLQALRVTQRAALESFQRRAEVINGRLVTSTAPDDSAMKAEWGRSRADLDVLEEVSSQYDQLLVENRGGAEALTALLAEIRTAQAAASADDARETLADVAGDTEETLAVVAALSEALTQDQNAVAARIAMASLSLDGMAAAIPDGAYFGDALGRRAQGQAAPPPADGGAQLVGVAEPLAIIRFAETEPGFEPAVFSIVYAALGRRPNAGFDLVGVSPSLTDETVAEETEAQSGPVFATRLDIGRNNAQRVRRALLSMGLPAERMTLDSIASPTAQDEEVHIYVR